MRPRFWYIRTSRCSSGDAATTPRPQSGPFTTAALLACFDDQAARLRAAADAFDAAQAGAPWIFRHGSQVITEQTHLYVYRIWCLNHLIHHRAQLCLYLRLLNIPVPTVYFNTADNPDFVYE